MLIDLDKFRKDNGDCGGITGRQVHHTIDKNSSCLVSEIIIDKGRSCLPQSRTGLKAIAPQCMGPCRQIHRYPADRT